MNDLFRKDYQPLNQRKAKKMDHRWEKGLRITMAGVIIFGCTFGLKEEEYQHVHQEVYPLHGYLNSEKVVATTTTHILYSLLNILEL